MARSGSSALFAILCVLLVLTIHTPAFAEFVCETQSTHFPQIGVDRDELRQAALTEAGTQPLQEGRESKLYDRCWLFAGGTPLRVIGIDPGAPEYPPNLPARPKRLLGVGHSETGWIARQHAGKYFTSGNGKDWGSPLGDAYEFMPLADNVDQTNMIIELVYSYDCSPGLVWKFAYAMNGKLYRMSFRRQSAETWTGWVEMTPPQWDPLKMIGRPGNFLVTRGRLFVGNYTEQKPGGPDDDAGAHVWRSLDCGSTWDEVFNESGDEDQLPPAGQDQVYPSGIKKARHIHALGADPDAANDPDPNRRWDVYISVGDTNPRSGLYRLRPAPQPPFDNTLVKTWLAGNGYGINMAFPPRRAVGGTPERKILLEGDGPNGGHLSAYQQSAPMFQGSIVNLIWPEDFSIEGPTDPSACAPSDTYRNSSWAGSGAGLAITKDGHAFYLTNGEKGCIGTRSGVWLARGPHFTTAVLLEDLTSDPSFFMAQASKTYVFGDNGWIFNSNFVMRMPRFRTTYLQ